MHGTVDGGDSEGTACPTALPQGTSDFTCASVIFSIQMCRACPPKTVRAQPCGGGLANQGASLKSLLPASPSITQASRLDVRPTGPRGSPSAGSPSLYPPCTPPHFLPSDQPSRGGDVCRHNKSASAFNCSKEEGRGECESVLRTVLQQRGLNEVPFPLSRSR